MRIQGAFNAPIWKPLFMSKFPNLDIKYKSLEIILGFLRNLGLEIEKC